jgi:hypothetical protein
MSNQYQVNQWQMHHFLCATHHYPGWQRLVLSLIRWMLIIVERALIFSLSFFLPHQPNQPQKTAKEKSSHIILYRHVSAIMSSSQMTFSQPLLLFRFATVLIKELMQVAIKCSDQYATCICSVPLSNERNQDSPTTTHLFI